MTTSLWPEKSWRNLVLHSTLVLTSCGPTCMDSSWTSGCIARWVYYYTRLNIVFRGFSWAEVFIMLQEFICPCVDRKGIIPLCVDRKGVIPLCVDRKGVIPLCVDRKGVIPLCVDGKGACFSYSYGRGAYFGIHMIHDRQFAAILATTSLALW